MQMGWNGICVEFAGNNNYYVFYVERSPEKGHWNCEETGPKKKKWCRAFNLPHSFKILSGVVILVAIGFIRLFSMAKTIYSIDPWHSYWTIYLYTIYMYIFGQKFCDDASKLWHQCAIACRIIYLFSPFALGMTFDCSDVEAIESLIRSKWFFNSFMSAKTTEFISTISKMYCLYSRHLPHVLETEQTEQKCW